MAAMLFLISVSTRAQTIVSGKITDSKYHVPLYPATVFDTTSGVATYADSAGQYRINVKGGDVILFSYLGFYSKRYIVPERLEYITHNVELTSKKQKLQAVEIRAPTPYQRDSLDRIKTFGHYLSLPVAHLIDPQFSNGITFHPFTYFSKGERRKRKFHKRYKKFEKEAFVDSRYTPQLVQKLTGLRKDTLRLFMFHHRPTYAYTRYASKLEFWSWITLHYKSWKDSLRKAKEPK